MFGRAGATAGTRVVPVHALALARLRGITRARPRGPSRDPITQTRRRHGREPVSQAPNEGCARRHRRRRRNAVASDATDATDAPPVLTSANLRAWIDARDDDGAGSRVELVKCPNDTPDVESSAMALGVPVDSIVKSIVFACDGCFAVCVTNGTARVDHKKIARRLGLANKRVRLATREETVAHAGYVPGTVPPFGHRTKLRTFVALDVVNDMAPDDVVFGGGGCVDVEVRCTVRDLVRLCEPCEVMDVKRDDDVSRGVERRRFDNRD